MAALTAVAFVSLLAGSSALASKGVVGVFGGVGTAGGQFGASSPRGVAVNQSNGDVYVVDGGNHRVERFSASGTFLSQIGTGTSGSANNQFNNPQGVAVDQLDGSVWVSDGGNFRAIKFNILGAFLAKTAFSTSGVADGQFASTFNGHLAVDPSGNVFVADPGGATSRRVQKFDSSAVFQAKFGSQGTAAGQFGSSPVSPSRVAIDGTGAIYVVDQGNARIQKCLSLGGAPETFSCTVFATYSATGTITLPHAVAVDRTNDNVLVARRNGTATGEVVVDEFDSAGTLLDTHGVGAGIGNTVSATTMNTTSALAIRESTGTIYLTISDTVRRVFMLNAVTAPTATIGTASGIGTHTATVSGQVNPNGSQTGYHFEYRKVGTATWTSSPTTDADAGSGSANVNVSQNLTGLQADADYETRLVATKPFNAGTATSTSQPFTTEPGPAEVVTLPADQLLPGGARLRGTINANNVVTTYHFEYGLTTSYGSTTPEAEIGGGDNGSIAKQVTGLSPDTTYHYRLVATNERGTVYGNDVELHTATVPQAPAGRGYEMVTPPNKPNRRGIVFSTPSAVGVGAGAIPAPGGDRVVVGVATGVLAEPGFSFANDFMRFDRTEGSWEGTSLLNVKAYTAPTATSVVPRAFSDDLLSSAWTSTSALRPEDAELAAQVAGTSTGQLKLPYDRSAEGVWKSVLSSPSQVSAPGSSATTSLSDNSVFSTDGSRRAIWGKYHGLLGATVEQDPSNSMLMGTGAGRAVYDVETTTGEMELVNACTGSGASATSIPSIDVGTGKQSTQACPAGSLTNTLGAAVGGGAAASSSTPNPATSTYLQGTAADALSSDGESMFFTSPDPVIGPLSCSGTGVTTSCPSQLFARTRDSGGDPVVRWISQSTVPNQDATLWGRGVGYEGAAEDGSKVFFRSNAPLTEDDPNATTAAPVTTGAASPNSWDLFQYELPDDPDDAGALIRLSGGPTPRAIGTGTLSAGSPTVTSKVTNTGTFAVGQTIAGTGIPAGTTITAVDATTLTLSQNASAPGTGVALSAVSDPNVICSTITSGSCSVFIGASARYISEDGSKVYFVTNAPIPGVPAPTNGTTTTPGGTPVNLTIRNLYLYDSTKPFSDRWTFIARLPLVTTNAVAACAAYGSISTPLFYANQSGMFGSGGTNCVSGTQSGDRISFLTDGQLTADDTDNAFDLYVYDAASGSDGDSLKRVSAPAPDAPTGAPYPCLGEGAQLCNAGTGRLIVATSGATASGFSHYNLTTNGDVVFDSIRPLVGADKNLTSDVYRWNDGVLSLVSPGTATGDHAVFAGASRDGRDIFFNTSQPIDPREVDSGDYDIYDARLGGGFPDPPVDPVPCDPLADQCQGDGPGSGQGDIQTGSNGPGDNSTSEARQRVRVLAPGRQEKLGAALTGTLTLRVTATAPGTVAVKALARSKKRPRRNVVVGSKRARVSRPGLVSVTLRLNKSARRQLASRKPLRLQIVADVPGGRATGLMMTLRRPGRTGGKR